jgi:hypothetical protein
MARIYSPYEAPMLDRLALQVLTPLSARMFIVNPRAPSESRRRTSTAWAKKRRGVGCLAMRVLEEYGYPSNPRTVGTSRKYNVSKEIEEE